jgi:Trk K+ transport system NAD-binding subunit
LARCLIIGCGCRGQALARELKARGHAVRGTTRDPGATAAIEAAGAEAIVGDPDRVATLAPALEHVSAAVILLGSATGSAEALGALHGTRLEMLLLRMLDSTVRGIVYEASGTVDPAMLGAGAQRVRAFCEGSRIPYSLLAGAAGAWPGSAADAVEGFWAEASGSPARSSRA